MYEHNTDLPSNWVWASLGELMDRLQYGFTAKANQSITGPKFLRITDINEGMVDWSSVPNCEIHVDEIEKYRLFEGDIVFARSGSIEKACMILNPPEAIFASYLIRGRPLHPTIGIWTKYFVQSRGYLSQIGAAASGIGMQNVNAKKIGSVSIPIAPLSEQSRITSKVESLQSHSSKARKALEAIPPLLEKFRQSVLSSAFRGDLTAAWRAQNPDVEPAEKLLERIRKEHRKRWEESELAKMKARGKEPKDDKWKKKYKEPEPVDITDLPELPEGWCWATIDTIAFVTKLAGFEYTKYVTYDPNGDLPVIKAENAGKYGFKETDFSFVQSESVTHLTRSFLKGGEVLMTFVGAGVGQVAMVPDGQQYFLGPNIAMIRNESSFVLPRYIELFLRSPLGFGLAMSFVKAVAQPSLSMKTIRKIPIAIPPIKEQKIIDSNLSQYNDIIEVVESIITTLKEKHLTLDQSILAKAFRGELVPQDPNDEPASQLLKRIKQEKASLESGKKKGARRGRAEKRL